MLWQSYDECRNKFVAYRGKCDNNVTTKLQFMIINKYIRVSYNISGKKFYYFLWIVTT